MFSICGPKYYIQLSTAGRRRAVRPGEKIYQSVLLRLARGFRVFLVICYLLSRQLSREEFDQWGYIVYGHITFSMYSNDHQNIFGISWKQAHVTVVVTPSWGEHGMHWLHWRPYLLCYCQWTPSKSNNLSFYVDVSHSIFVVVWPISALFIIHDLGPTLHGRNFILSAEAPVMLSCWACALIRVH